MRRKKGLSVFIFVTVGPLCNLIIDLMVQSAKALNRKNFFLSNDVFGSKLIIRKMCPAGRKEVKMENCGYCQKGELLAKFGIEICELDVSTLILFKEQSHPGRCIVAYKDHVSELVNISDEERNAYFADVARAAKAIHKAFSPDKVNYGAYGDTGCHLHVHLVPKYKNGFEWGGVFEMNPGKTYLTDAEYAEMIGKIKACL